MIIIFLEMLWFLAVDLIVNCQLCNKITRNYHKYTKFAWYNYSSLFDEGLLQSKSRFNFLQFTLFLYIYLQKLFSKSNFYKSSIGLFFMLTLLFRAKLVAWHTIDIRGKTLVICTYWSWKWYIVEIVKIYRKSEIKSTN